MSDLAKKWFLAVSGVVLDLVLLYFFFALVGFAYATDSARDSFLLSMVLTLTLYLRLSVFWFEVSNGKNEFIRHAVLWAAFLLVLLVIRFFTGA